MREMRGGVMNVPAAVPNEMLGGLRSMKNSTIFLFVSYIRLANTRSDASRECVIE